MFSIAKSRLWLMASMSSLDLTFHITVAQSLQFKEPSMRLWRSSSTRTSVLAEASVGDKSFIFVVKGESGGNEKARVLVVIEGTKDQFKAIEQLVLATNCGFVKWLDRPMCARAMQVIPGLIRSKNIVEQQLNEKTIEARNLKVLLITSWVFFVYVYFC